METPKGNQFNQPQPPVIDRGEIASRELGFVGGSLGGTMTRRLVELGEKVLAEQQKNPGGQPPLQ